MVRAESFQRCAGVRCQEPGGFGGVWVLKATTVDEKGPGKPR